MPDLRKFGQALNRILPFLASEKMEREKIRRWLESTFQEISAREASEGRTILAREASTGRTQAQAAQDAIAEILGRSTTKSLEDISGGRLQMPGALTETLDPRYTGGIRVPPEYAAEVARINDAIKNLNAQYQAGQPIGGEVSGALATQVAPGILQDIVKAGEAGKIARGGQALTKEQQAIDIESQKIRREELAVKKGEVKIGGAKDAAATMKEAQNDIDLATKQYSGVGSFMTASPDAKKALTAIIKKANNRIDTAAKSLGIESPIKNRQEMREVGLSILSRYAATGAFPRSYDLILMGYDPDFVFGLEDSLKKSDKKVEPTERERMNKALAMIKAILEGKVE